MSEFIKEQINKRLKELRNDCALQREHLRNAFGFRWSGCQRRNPEKPDEWEKHWEDLQAKAQAERPQWVKDADKKLFDFIEEHRPIMGADWPGTNHGRLCWAPFLGGRPIGHYYCQLDEGHEGAHSNLEFAWPQNVTNETEWFKLSEVCPHTNHIHRTRDNILICEACGKPIKKEESK